MPRNISGVYTVPSGINPVVAGTIIQDTWANPTLADVAQGITDSLDRSGRGAMLAALKIIDGTVGVPGLAFGSEPGTGLYRPGAGVAGFSILGAEVWRASAAQFSVLAGSAAVPPYSFTGNLTAGLYSGGANILGFATAGLSRGTISAGGLWNIPDAAAAGRVFTVNTTGAGETFGIIGTGNQMTQAFHVQNTTVGNAAGSYLYTASDTTALIMSSYSSIHTTYPGRTRLFTNSPVAIGIGTNNIDRLDISSTGVVSILTAGQMLRQVLSNSGAANEWYLGNTSASAGADSVMHLSASGTIPGGSAYNYFEIDGGEAAWSAGACRVADGANYVVSESNNMDDTYARMKIWLGGRISFRNIHDNVDSVSGTTDQFLASGTWTPVITSILNTINITEKEGSWTRVGNVVTCNVGFEAQASATAGAATRVSITLPIASNFANDFQCQGAGGSINAGSDPISILGNTAGDYAVAAWDAFASGILVRVCVFQYVIV